MIFPSDQVGKGEKNFPTTWAGLTKENSICQRVKPKIKKKGRRIKLLVSPGRQNKDEVFKLAEKRLIMYWTQAITNVNVPMKYVLEFLLQDYKQKSTNFLKLLLDEFPNLHLVHSFHNSDILTSLVIDIIFQFCILFFVFL